MENDGKTAATARPPMMGYAIDTFGPPERWNLTVGVATLPVTSTLSTRPKTPESATWPCRDACRWVWGYLARPTPASLKRRSSMQACVGVASFVLWLHHESLGSLGRCHAWPHVHGHPQQYQSKQPHQRQRFSWYFARPVRVYKYLFFFSSKDLSFSLNSLIFNLLSSIKFLFNFK